MDIYECNDRYGITLKKLQRMNRDGVLKLDSPKTPEYWRRVLLDIRKGKMTARSIALAFRYPEKLHAQALLTPFDRAVIDKHFKKAELPAEALPITGLTSAVFGASERHPVLMGRLIEALARIIPARHVGYEYVAVRLMLTCPNDHEIYLMAERISQALLYAMDTSAMKGWSHREPAPYGKYRRIYHQPEGRYDL